MPSSPTCAMSEVTHHPLGRRQTRIQRLVRGRHEQHIHVAVDGGLAPNERPIEDHLLGTQDIPPASGDGLEPGHGHSRHTEFRLIRELSVRWRDHLRYPSSPRS